MKNKTNIMEGKKNKDFWDKFNIIIYCISALSVPFITIFIWIKSNEFQELLRNKEDNSKRFEHFVSLYPKLISNDSIERIAASKVIIQLGEKDTVIKMMAMDILKLKDPPLAVKTLENIKNNPLSDPKSKQKAKEILNEIKESFATISLEEIPERIVLLAKLDEINNLWSIYFNKISDDDIELIKANFKKRETTLYLLTFNQTKKSLELSMRPPLICQDIKISNIIKHKQMMISFSQNNN